MRALPQAGYGTQTSGREPDGEAEFEAKPKQDTLTSHREPDGGNKLEPMAEQDGAHLTSDTEREGGGERREMYLSHT